MRAKELMNKADLVLFLIDGSIPLSQEDNALFQEVSRKPVLTVVNKSDLYSGQRQEVTLCQEGRWVEISAKNQLGIDALRKAIFKKITGGNEQWEENGCSPNLRHKVALQKAISASGSAIETLNTGLTNDLIAVDLQECLDCLGEIVGETTTDDILDVVFEQFCLGK